MWTHRISAGVQGHPKQTGIRGKKSKDSSAWVSTLGQWVCLPVAAAQAPHRHSFHSLLFLILQTCFFNGEKASALFKSPLRFRVCTKSVKTRTHVCEVIFFFFFCYSIFFFFFFLLLRRCLLWVAQLCEKYQWQRLLRQRKHLILDKQLSKPMSNS